MDASLGHKYKAFISYSHADEHWAVWLHKALERYRVPKHLRNDRRPARALIPVFRDREELGTSNNLSQSIREALADSEFLIVICSPEAVASRWVDEEIAAFRELGSSNRIIYCVVSGRAPDVFPPSARSDIEPLAADVSPQADGRRNAFLKIVARMLDVGFDELRQRESRVRQQRLMTIAGASSAGMLLAMGLAIYAMIQQQAAERERARAEVEATTSRQVTEFLTGLFRVLDPSEGSEYTLTARELLDIGARRVEQELSDAPLVRARMMRIMGEVYQSLSLYDDAASLLERSLDEYTTLVTAGDRERLKNLRHLADVYMVLGREEEARSLISEALSASDAAWGVDHSEFALALKSSWLLTGRNGDGDEARSILLRVLAILEDTLPPDDPAIASAIIDLGGVEWEMGNHEMAVQLIERGAGIYERTLGDSHPDTQIAQNFLATLYAEQGDNEQAVLMMERTLAGMERSFGPDHLYVAASLTNLGIRYGWNGQADRGEELLARALRIFEDVRGSPQSMARGNLAWVQHMAGKPTLAAQNFERALEASTSQHNTAVILLDYARLQLDRDRVDEAIHLLKRCVGIMEGINGVGNPQSRECFIELESAIDRMASQE